MTEQNRALALHWFAEVWDKANPDAIDQYFSPDGHAYGFPTPESALGLAEYKALHANFTKTFSGIKVTIHDTIAEGDRVAIRWTATMTHTGDALGSAATGKPVTIPGASFCRIVDGKIMDGWNFTDFTKVVAELKA
jgi:steroid delta-isomerase-like uncharacterized protein